MCTGLVQAPTAPADNVHNSTLQGYSRWRATHGKEEGMEKDQPTGPEPATSMLIYSQPFGS